MDRASLGTGSNGSVTDGAVSSQTVNCFALAIILREFHHVPLQVAGISLDKRRQRVLGRHIPPNLASFGTVAVICPNIIQMTASGGTNSFNVLDLMPRARGTDAKAVVALQTNARFLGLGLATIVNLINPDSIYLPGEITTAWDLIERLCAVR
jgi:hypothetical protein